MLPSHPHAPTLGDQGIRVPRGANGDRQAERASSLVTSLGLFCCLLPVGFCCLLAPTACWLRLPVGFHRARSWSKVVARRHAHALRPPEIGSMRRRCCRREVPSRAGRACDDSGPCVPFYTMTQVAERRVERMSILRDCRRTYRFRWRREDVGDRASGTTAPTTRPHPPGRLHFRRSCGPRRCRWR